MKTIEFTGQFKKDFKRYRNDKAKVEMELSEKYRLHKLIGNYKGCWECHVDGDFLLIWIDEAADIIKAVRLGSHSELF